MTRGPVQTPLTVVGTVSQPVFTGWHRDYCNNGHLAAALPDCLQHGGEIYRVMLLDARTIEGRRIARKLVIAFPAHALAADYVGQKRINLVRAPEPFSAATGIGYLAHTWSDTQLSVQADR